MPQDERKCLVEKHKELSLTKQTGILEIGRTSIYSRPHKVISKETIELMHKIDRIHTAEPTWGYRIAELEEENYILKKASAFFAKNQK